LGPRQTLKLTFAATGAQSGHSFTRSVEVGERERRTVVLPVSSQLRYGALKVRGPGVNGGDAPMYFSQVNPRQRAVLNIGSPDTFTHAVNAKPSYSGAADTQVVSLSPEDAPSELLPYVGWDAVILSGVNLQALSQAQRAALEQYAALGGQLVLMQSARGLKASLPLIDDDSPHYGLGQVVFAQPGRYPAELDRPVRVPLLAVEHKGGRQRYGYGTQDGMDAWLPEAATPIGRFIVIIILFTLAIGPGSFFIARRKGPATLLVTIPGTATLTCALIVGYSAFRDGFSVHAAVQGFTLLDARNHRAVTASVGAFYANLAPNGARFGPDAVPVAPSPANEYQSVEQAASMGFDEGLKVGGDFIPSRSYIEWSFLSAQPTRARLVVKKEGGTVRLQNALGGHLDSVEVNLNGNQYRALELNDGEEKVATPTEDRLKVSPELIARASEPTRAVLDAPLREGEFLAWMQGSGFTPLGGLVLNQHGSRHLVRGSVEP
jgi:hypothetical protein